MKTTIAITLGQVSQKGILLVCLILLCLVTILFPHIASTAEAEHKTSISELKERAEHGDVDAQFNLGVSYDNGQGVPQDYAEAAKWYRMAAAQGDEVAQWTLGYMYAEGQGVPQDYTEAVKWCRQAAEQGYAKAQYNLGVMYCNGQGIPQDYVEAAKWYRKAAEQGDAKAQYNLGIMYNTSQGVPQDYVEAAKWYRKAAEQGNAICQFKLGVMYAKGQGVSQDYAEAVKWFHKAAEQGNAIGQFNLGVSYDSGQGVPQDCTEAAKWYRKAAEQGDATAQYNLGVKYHNGEGVPQDYVEAYKWYSLAAAQGDESGTKWRNSLRDHMTPDQIAEAQRRASAFFAKQQAAKESSIGEQSPTPSASQPAAPKASGTGFLISSDGYILTAAHVLTGATEVKVVTSGGTKLAKIVRIDTANDLAVVKTDGSFSAIPVIGSRGVKLGDTVFTIGFPNPGLQGFSPKLTRGEINSLFGVQDDPRHYQISAAVQPGNSGGPLVNQDGNVVGVVVARMDDATALNSTGFLPQNVNYAIKSAYILPMLESIPNLAKHQPDARPTGKQPAADAVSRAEAATCLILAY